MEQKTDKIEKLIAKFESIRLRNGALWIYSSGGIFTAKTRKKLLGILPRAEPGKSRNDFWCDRRKQVEQALIDLQLFIEAAEDDQVNQVVVTQETLAPVVETLLHYPVVYRAEPDLKRAEISQLFIEMGFIYLSDMMPGMMSLSHKQTKDAAIDLANFLVESFRPEKERRYPHLRG